MKDELKILGTSWKMRIEYDASNNAIYVGEAKAGTATDATGWRIKKITYDGSNNATQVDWADNNTNEDNIWDNRASLSYG